MCFFKYSWRAVETLIFLTHRVPYFLMDPVHMLSQIALIRRLIGALLTFIFARNNVGFVNQLPVHIPPLPWLSALQAVGLGSRNINRKSFLAIHIISVKYAHILTFPQLPSLDNPSCGSSKHFCYLLWQKSHSLHLYCFIIFFCALFSLSLFSSSVSFNFIFACPNAYIENLWLFQIIFVRGFMAWIMRLIGTLLTRELFVPHCMNLWENSLPY